MNAQKVAAVGQADESVGRLRELGVLEPWQAALLLPHRWDDFLWPLSSLAGINEGDLITVRGLVSQRPVTRFDKKPPRTITRVALASGEVVVFMVFGDVRDSVGKLEVGDELVLTGAAKRFSDDWWITNPCVAKGAWAGRLRPVYPGKPGRIGADLVRTRVLEHLRQGVLEGAAQAISKRMAWLGDLRVALARLASPTDNLTELLRWCHLPPTEDRGRAAHRSLEVLANADALHQLEEHRARAPAARALDLATLVARVGAIPFTLSPDQQRAMDEISADLQGPHVTHRILSGEVASGKSAVFGALAAATCDDIARHDEDRCVVVILPSESLARQMARDFHAWWPDLRTALVTSDTNPDTRKARFLVGTSALLNRPLPEVALLVVDEQQKLSTGQREQLRGQQTHLLEVSATCIPRTMALVKYGAVGVTRLERGHADRQIDTTVWRRDQKREIFKRVIDTIDAGDAALIVYPAIDTDEASAIRSSVLTSLGRWERQFPGKVRSIHSRLPILARQAALADVVEGRARILTSTTIIEVGVNIPRLRQVVVVHPERFATNVLHQIRGRLAREGGAGRFDMLAMDELEPATLERLEILVRCSSGFDVAEADMLLRGFGDLGTLGARQSGYSETFLPGRSVSPKAANEAISAGLVSG